MGGANIVSLRCHLGPDTNTGWVHQCFLPTRLPPCDNKDVGVAA